MTTTHTTSEELPLSVKRAANRLHEARAELKEASDAFLATVEAYGKQKAGRRPAELPQEDAHHE